MVLLTLVVAVTLMLAVGTRPPTRYCVFLALALLWPTEVRADWVKWLYRGCQVAAGIGHGLDATSTMYILGAGKGTELNTVYGKNPGPVKFALLKGTTATGSIILVDRFAELSRTRMFWGAVTNCGLGATFTAVGLTNLTRTGIR